MSQSGVKGLGVLFAIRELQASSFGLVGLGVTENDCAVWPVAGSICGVFMVTNDLWWSLVFISLAIAFWVFLIPSLRFVAFLFYSIIHGRGYPTGQSHD